MKERIPIIDGEGNCCPKCGSLRITVHEQRNLFVQRNLSSGRVFVMKKGKMRNMSNRDKAIEFDCADISAGCGCWIYECRKCGWTSEMYTE